LGDGILHGILDALCGGSDEFDLFVGMVAHKENITLFTVTVDG
jgi:hypothetical protein